MSLLTGLGVMETVDRWGLVISDAIASCPVDRMASVFSFLGNIEVTGLIALILSVMGWWRHGVGGLVPLLLFAGVAIEIAMKYFLLRLPPHPVSRCSWNLAFLHPSAFLALHYSFPSGHMLRTTFLAVLIGGQVNRYRTAGHAFIVAMAVTRVYLDEHWISDVIGGLLLGLTLAAVAAALNPPRCSA
jgi:undecaprenyl-diphosphatase